MAMIYNHDYASWFFLLHPIVYIAALHTPSNSDWAHQSKSPKQQHLSETVSNPFPKVWVIFGRKSYFLSIRNQQKTQTKTETPDCPTPVCATTWGLSFLRNEAAYRKAIGCAKMLHAERF